MGSGISFAGKAATGTCISSLHTTLFTGECNAEVVRVFTSNNVWHWPLLWDTEVSDNSEGPTAQQGKGMAAFKHFWKSCKPNYAVSAVLLITVSNLPPITASSLIFPTYTLFLPEISAWALFHYFYHVQGLAAQSSKVTPICCKGNQETCTMLWH